MIPEPDEPVECPWLFVYGTLRRGCELHHNRGHPGERRASSCLDLLVKGAPAYGG